MRPSALVDYEFAVAQSGYVVRALLKLAGRTPDARGRLPMNLALVLDRSGSMEGAKLAAAREAAALLVRRLSPDDVVSVVTYDDRVTTVASPATGAAQPDLVRRLLAIEAGGSTNLSGGWLRGRELAESVRREGAVNRVVLLTDGQANAGITDPARLTALAAGARADGVTTTTIGFGADYDESLLRAMADAGGGNTYYVERPDQAPGVFEEELDGLLTLSAQNVAIEVRPGPGVRFVRLHHDYPCETTAAGLRVELGDLYAREPRALLVELFVPEEAVRAGDATMVTHLADVVVHAHVLTDAGGVERQTVRFPVASPLAPRGHEEPEVRRETLLLTAARAREEALRARDRGDLDAGGRALREAVSALAAAPSDGALLEEIRDLEEMARLFSAHEVAAHDAKYLAQRAYNAHRKKDLYQAKLSRMGRGPDV